MLERPLDWLMAGLPAQRLSQRLEPYRAALNLGTFLLGLAGAGAIARHHAFIGLGVFALSRLMAQFGTRGQAWAPVFQTIVYAAMPFAFALAAPERAIAMIFLLFGYVAEVAGRARFGKGVVTGVELFLLYAVLVAVPNDLVAYIGGMLCFLSAGLRGAGIPASSKNTH